MWVIPTPEKQALYRAVFSWAFLAALPVSEYTYSDLVEHNLQYGNISRTFEGEEMVYKLWFNSYKGHPQGNDIDFSLGSSSSQDVSSTQYGQVSHLQGYKSRTSVCAKRYTFLRHHDFGHPRFLHLFPGLKQRSLLPTQLQDWPLHTVGHGWHV